MRLLSYARQGYRVYCLLRRQCQFRLSRVLSIRCEYWPLDDFGGAAVGKPDFKVDHDISFAGTVPDRRVWIGDRGVIVIFFDSKDNVVSKSYCYVEPTNPN